MNDALLIPLLLGLAAIAMVVIAGVARGIWREMKDATGDAESETRSERRTEERKNKRIAREIKSRRWSDEEMHDAKRRQTASHWLEKEDAR